MNRAISFSTPNDILRKTSKKTTFKPCKTKKCIKHLLAHTRHCIACTKTEKQILESYEKLNDKKEKKPSKLIIAINNSLTLCCRRFNDFFLSNFLFHNPSYVFSTKLYCLFGFCICLLQVIITQFIATILKRVRSINRSA